LSPRKVIMDVRDRAEEIIKNKSFTVSEEHTKITITDGKSLFDKITKEELYACTTCNACVEACPVLINPLQVILELRRYDILMRSEGPQEWLAMFNSLENNQAAWTMSESRIQWINN
jgi:Fe-S oxidoreductase